MAVFGFEQLTSYCFTRGKSQNLQEKANNFVFFHQKKPL